MVRGRDLFVPLGSACARKHAERQGDGRSNSLLATGPYSRQLQAHVKLVVSAEQRISFSRMSDRTHYGYHYTI